ncbi:sagB-type dehydrogenase domain-containing protein [Prevotella sp. CAG:1185]|uniref:nitroreductase family protein n=1 Tax=uncultured Prevotella sp. TaxID=159272 RepID=UPI00033F1271|nr:SagB/ThcOx family dehydrogenase [uncultured Prevotella sp.]CCY83980.1 sagB-type dehydrogenase domain-containing protein [Prevotella sp. CAG:1185]
MKKNGLMKIAFVTMLGLTCFYGNINAQETKLPEPKKSNTEGSLMKALQDRHSSRTFADKSVTDQTLADLLWAADGINRSDGKRTAPSARNMQDITIYVGKADGTFRYDAKANALIKIGNSDLRKAVSGRNKFIQTAPIVLVIASDTSLLNGNMALSGIDAGTVVQNVYLYCAANGLGTVCCYAGEDTTEVQKFLGIKAENKPLVYMPVGY